MVASLQRRTCCKIVPSQVLRRLVLRSYAYCVLDQVTDYSEKWLATAVLTPEVQTTRVGRLRPHLIELRCYAGCCYLFSKCYALWQ
jgi:hypothetical protein